ncbi:MAG: MSCRAMM family protein [Candidatus Sumerlaeaceae bacterium]
MREPRWQTLLVVIAVAVAAAVLVWRLHAPRARVPEVTRSQQCTTQVANVGLPLQRSQPRRAAVGRSMSDEETSTWTRGTVATLESRIASPQETTVPEGRATLIVTVLDRRTDQPIADVRIEGSRWESLSTFVGEEQPRSLAQLQVIAQADGSSLRLSPIPAPSRVWLRLGAKGYETVEVGPVELPSDGAVVRQVFFLSQHASVVGRVVRKSSHEPVAGARVWLAAAEPRRAERINTAMTSADGRFEISDVPAGRRYVVVRPPSLAPDAVVDLSVLPGQRHDLGDIEISNAGAEVKGRVIRGPSAEPVTTATVELVPQAPADREILRTTTDARGEFCFGKLANGAYMLNLPDHAYSRPLLLAPDEQREVVINLGGLTLHGRLLSGGKPISGSIALTLGPHGMGPARTAFAGDDGRYELSGLQPGRWTVALWGPKAAMAVETVTLPAAPTVERDFVLATGKIVGKVVEQTGLPVAGATVECTYQPEHPYASFLSPRVVRTRTATDGSFELGPLPEGTFSVRAEHATEGFALSPPVAVPRSGNSAPVEIRLERVRGATLRSVALSFETGAPIREAFLVLYDAAGRVARSAQRNDAGMAEVRGLPPGSYRMEVSASGYTADIRTIELHDGQERTIESVLATAGALRVWVENSLGQAIEGAKLTLEPTDPDSLEEPRQGVSELGGLWVVRGLTPGAYRLSVEFALGEKKTYSLVVRPREVTETFVRGR